jgi:hypothetical protein
VYGLFVFLFSLGQPQTGTAAAFLLLSYLIMMVAYLGQAALRARDNNLSLPKGGLIGHSEIMIFMVACCVYPTAFPAFCALFGLLCLATAIIRALTFLRAL